MGVVALATYSHGCDGRSPSLKTLINTIISTFTDIQEFSLGCLFVQKLKFPLKYPLLLLRLLEAISPAV